jgi:DNA polymerase/3'-5' exonuclease PolX
VDENQEIAARLREAAALLEARDASPYRVAAYRRAADSLVQSPQPVREIFDARGRAGLRSLPGVGEGISSAIAEMLITGEWSQLARLRDGREPPLYAEGDPPAQRQLEMELV